MLTDFFKSNERCIGCMFYSRYFKQYNAPLVLKAYTLPESNYRYGMKPCVKNKDFTWFNSICVNFRANPKPLSRRRWA